MYTKKIIGVNELIGLTKDGEKATTHQARKVVCFVDSDRKCKFTYGKRDSIVMATRDGRVLFRFTKHPKLNYYTAEINNDQELRVALKKTTGKLKRLKKVPLPDYVVERLYAEGYYQ